MRIQTDRTAVVLVDMQVDVLAAVDQSAPDRLGVTATLLESTERLIRAARTAHIPVIWVKVERRPDLMDQADVMNQLIRAGTTKGPRETHTLIAGTVGADFADPLEPAEDEDVVVKRRVSGFHGTALDCMLRARGISTILLGGVNTEMGVESTARAAWDHDYHSVVLADCCMSTNPTSHEHALRYTLPRFAEVSRLDEVVSEAQP